MMEATKRFIDAGSVSTALTPAKPFVPTDTPPQFTVAGVTDRPVCQSGGISAVVAPKESCVSNSAPMVFFSPTFYAEQGGKLIEIASPRSKEVMATGVVDDIETGVPFEDGNTVKVKVGKKIARLSNFSVEILAEIRTEYLRSSETVLLLRLCGARGCENYKIRKSAFLNLAAKLRCDRPVMRLYPDSGRQEAFFRVYLSQKVEEAEGHIPFTIVYGYAGWQQIESGAWHYFSGLDVGRCHSERCLIDLSLLLLEEQFAADRFALHVLDLGDIFTMLPLFLHMHTGFLKRLFEEAGVPVRFIVNLFGPTGIGKTLLMMLLFCPFTTDKSMANFTSSASGLERFFEQFHDGMAVLDDLSSIVDTGAKRTLERLLRQYCDGNGRITAARGSEGYRVNDMSFGLIMTAETLLEGEKQSSQLRFLNIPIETTTLNDAVVKEFRKLILQNPKQGSVSPLDVYLTRFVGFVECHFAELVRFILDYEPPQISTRFRRHEATYRVIATVAQIVLKYFVYAKTMTAEQADKIFVEQWLPALQGLIQFNSRIGQQTEPVRIYLDTLQQGIGARLILISENREGFEREPNTFLGFWHPAPDGLKLFIDPDRSYQFVKAQFDKMRLTFSVAPRQLLQMLANAGLSEGYHRKDRKTPKPLKELKINGVTVKMLVLRWEKIRKYLEQQ